MRSFVKSEGKFPEKAYSLFERAAKRRWNLSERGFGRPTERTSRAQNKKTGPLQARGPPFSVHGSTYLPRSSMVRHFSPAGRFSGSRIVLPTAPSQGYHVPSGIMRLSSPATAAGPLLNLTGFPFVPRVDGRNPQEISIENYSNRLRVTASSQKEADGDLRLGVRRAPRRPRRHSLKCNCFVGIFYNCGQSQRIGHRLEHEKGT